MNEKLPKPLGRGPSTIEAFEEFLRWILTSIRLILAVGIFAFCAGYLYQIGGHWL
jgi:hypothetical protein